MFTITSAFNFLDGPMGWDASRIAAAIPSGVGFLGAGLIFKDTQTNKKTGVSSNVVHGLTTAASLWIVRDLFLSYILPSLE
jgi:putative Mg2+ transporter-C (MgtC) family protein